MSTALAESFTAQREDQLTYAPETIQRLVVSDNDPNLLARVERTFEATRLLDRPQASWRLDDRGELLEEIIHAANEGVSEIVLTGSSTAFLSPEPDFEWESSELYDRAKLAYLERHQARVHFAEQVHGLRSHPEIEPRVADSCLTLRPFFYSAEADLLMAYQPESGKFEMP